MIKNKKIKLKDKNFNGKFHRMGVKTLIDNLVIIIDNF